MTHYRYEREYPFMDDLGEMRINLVEFETVKETKCGCWIKRKGYFRGEKFVLKDARKKYAYPTKGEAFRSFRIRTSKSLEYAKRDVRNAAIFMKLIAEAEINDIKDLGVLDSL